MTFYKNMGITRDGFYLFLTIIFSIGILLNVFYFSILHLIKHFEKRKEKKASLTSGLKTGKTDHQDSDIFTAIEHGDTDSVKEMIKRRSDLINKRDREYLTPLHKAIMCCKKDLIELLINNGSDVNSGDALRRTPLHWASLSGQLELVEFLISKGANVNSANENGETALHNAASIGNQELADILIKNGANLDAETEIGNMTPWEIAWASGYKELAKHLHSKGSMKKEFNK